MMRPPKRKAMSTSKKAEIFASTRLRVRFAMALNCDTLTVWQRKLMTQNRKNLQRAEQVLRRLPYKLLKQIGLFFSDVIYFFAVQSRRQFKLTFQHYR